MAMNSQHNVSRVSATKIESMKQIKAAYIAAQKAGAVKTYLIQSSDLPLINRTIDWSEKQTPTFTCN